MKSPEHSFTLQSLAIHREVACPFAVTAMVPALRNFPSALSGPKLCYYITRRAVSNNKNCLRCKPQNKSAQFPLFHPTSYLLTEQPRHIFPDTFDFLPSRNGISAILRTVDSRRLLV